MTQPPLNFNAPFDGDDYDDDRDRPRLRGQIERVHHFMEDGDWYTLDQISSATGDPHSSVSAQLRHLRKKKFGSYTIIKKYEGNGLYLYRMLAPDFGTQGELVFD